tara:strand:- start:34 stop:981 length:948 start_codon:yes stop_codon:yes gene_type:complete
MLIYMHNNQFNNILVVKHGSLGDIAFSLLAMASIKKNFSNANIDLLTEEKYINFLKSSNYFKTIIRDNRRGIIDSLKVIFKIKRNKYDLVIDLQNSKRTNNYWALLKFISKVKINGSRSNCDIQYVIPPQGSESPQNGLYNQLKLIGINEINQNIDWLSTNISEINKDNIILMVPGVSKSGKDKQWSPSNFAKLASSLEKKGYNICVVGQKTDKETVINIKNQCQQIIDLTDKSPPEVIYSVAKKSNFVISNDTGPGHIAALSKSPILFLAKDNVISKSNLSEYKNSYYILSDTMESISVKYVLDFLNDKKLINK